MELSRKHFPARSLAAALVLLAGTARLGTAQSVSDMTAGQTVLTFVNRLVINPPQVSVFGYFVNFQGLPGPLFSGTPGEGTAYFTWSLDAAGAVQIQNGDPNAAGGLSVAALPTGRMLNVYYNANPNQSWSDPASFSAGQLIATFRSRPGTQTGTGPVALVTQSYVLASSQDFTFKGQTYNLARTVPHGVTFVALSGNVPLGGAQTPPLTFTAAGSGIAIGGPVSVLPRWY